MTTSFAPDVNTPLPAVLESHGFATTRYLYGLDLLAERSGTEWLYYHADGLGSTRSLTDGLGDVAGAYLYAPFGNQLYANGPSVDFRFTGEQADDPTGWYFLRARYYDPATGRFTQRDPFQGMLTDPQTQNPYAYAVNNPVRYTDPSGKCIFGLDTAICVEISWFLLEQLITNDLKDGSFDTPNFIRTAVGTTVDVATSNPLGGYRDPSLSNLLSGQSASTSPDVTGWLVSTMNANASGAIAGTLRNAYTGGLDSKAAAFIGWTALVKGKTPWDFKVEFGNRIRNVTLGCQNHYMDVVANIHYGFVGAASGFSQDELLVGAGIAQIFAGTTQWSFWRSNFDDPDDQTAIQLGYWLYQTYKAEMTEAQFIQGVNQYHNRLKPPVPND